MEAQLRQSRPGREQGGPGKGQTCVPYRSGGVRFGPMLEQHVDDVRVALLGGLVQRRVAVLWTTGWHGPRTICKRRGKVG